MGGIHVTQYGKGKGKGSIQSLMDISMTQYGVSLATWDHTVLPATRHK